MSLSMFSGRIARLASVVLFVLVSVSPIDTQGVIRSCDLRGEAIGVLIESLTKRP